MSRGRWAKASACRLQVSLSCAVLCQIVSLQYLSRSSHRRLAGLPCRLFLSWSPSGDTRGPSVIFAAVERDMYLGQHYSIKEKNQGKEIHRRIMAGWAAYAKHRDSFKGTLAICLKRQVYNSCVLPAMTYGADTWTLTKQAQNKLSAAQTKMERSMLNITYKDRKTTI